MLKDCGFTGRSMSQIFIGDLLRAYHGEVWCDGDEQQVSQIAGLADSTHRMLICSSMLVIHIVWYTVKEVTPEWEVGSAR